MMLHKGCRNRTQIDLDTSDDAEYFDVQARANDLDAWRCLKPSAGLALLDEVIVSCLGIQGAGLTNFVE